MKVTTEKVFNPVTIRFETEEELKHLIACMSISDGDRLNAAKCCSIQLNEEIMRTVSSELWDSLQDIYMDLRDKS